MVNKETLKKWKIKPFKKVKTKEVPLSKQLKLDFKKLKGSVK